MAVEQLPFATYFDPDAGLRFTVGKDEEDGWQLTVVGKTVPVTVALLQTAIDHIRRTEAASADSGG